VGSCPADEIQSKESNLSQEVLNEDSPLGERGGERGEKFKDEHSDAAEGQIRLRPERCLSLLVG